MNQKAKQELEILIQQLKEMIGIYRGALSHTGVSENEFWIWYALIVFDKEYSQQDICNMWSLAKQTVNNIIAHMVLKGYATLVTVPDTRNKKIIRLTEKGREYGTELIRPVHNAEERALNRLDSTELIACTKALSRFIGVLKEEFNES